MKINKHVMVYKVVINTSLISSSVNLTTALVANDIYVVKRIKVASSFDQLN